MHPDHFGRPACPLRWSRAHHPTLEPFRGVLLSIACLAGRFESDARGCPTGPLATPPADVLVSRVTHSTRPFFHDGEGIQQSGHTGQCVVRVCGSDERRRGQCRHHPISLFDFTAWPQARRELSAADRAARCGCCGAELPADETADPSGWRWVPRGRRRAGSVWL